jgi:hypothetical protein
MAEQAAQDQKRGSQGRLFQLIRINQMKTAPAFADAVLSFDRPDRAPARDFGITNGLVR